MATSAYADAHMYGERSFITPFKSKVNMPLGHLLNFFSRNASLYRQLYLTPLEHYPIQASFFILSKLFAGPTDTMQLKNKRLVIVGKQM